MQAQYIPHNLRDPLHDHRYENNRVDRFLDERRRRNDSYGNYARGARDSREEEDERHARLAQDLRDATPELFMDYLHTLCTNLDSMTEKLQSIDLRDGAYQARSAYKYGRPATPSFSGSDATFIDFVRECIAYCRVKKS